ncbi:hypothetical protein Z945_219 [Sulfitobacter noctilucae]|uniref:hypothetical protein n=1 Tax=Sulfitobacter noctilucae TaxID=1342302 RepID=UPI000468249E|nr:hypothetical protein [Sulfitobacter noctilucae]KIN75390.1 hypothetical protein Z945_219 [Sulfitobacter noctilucae]
MSRSLSLFAIGLVFGGGIGFVTAAGTGASFDGHDHSDPAQHQGMDHSMMDHSAMGHGTSDHAMSHDAPIEVTSDTPPTVAIAVTPDPMAGYNLHVMTKDFTFSPQNASGANVPGEGHAHVYVNGNKLGRLYGDWMHIDTLPKGAVEIKVTLNANDHSPLAVDGTLVSATQTLNVE